MSETEDERVKRLTGVMQRELTAAMGPLKFETVGPSLYEKIKTVFDTVLGPIVAARAKEFVVTPAPEPGDEEKGIFRVNLSVPSDLIADWPADRLLAIGIAPKDILAFYGLDLVPWDREAAFELCDILMHWERELRGPELKYGPRRITQEMLKQYITTK